jgi:uncharacterized protein
MSSETPDNERDFPDLWPRPGDRDLRANSSDTGEPEPEPGFGFWMAVVWCILFFVATQIIIGLACGIPLILIATIPDIVNQNGPPPGPAGIQDMMKSNKVQVATMLTVMCSHLGGVLFGWYFLRRQVGPHWKRKIALSRRPTLTHAVLVLIGLVAMLAVGTCIEVPIERFVPSLEDIAKKIGFDFPVKGAEMIPEMIKACPLALALFTVGVLPAFDEEFLCRGLVAWGLSFRYPAWAVVGMTSFLFGCLHVDPRQGLGAMFLGVAMHFAYISTRSLWVPMTLHFLNNGLAVIHFYYEGRPLAVLQPLANTMEAAPLLFAASGFLLFAAVAYALYQTRCKLVSINPDMPVWEPPSRSGVELPPPGSGTIVTHDPLSPLSVCFVLLGAVAFGLVLSFA